MTTAKAQQMVQDARVMLSQQRQDRGEFSGDAAYTEAWQILFAAENLIADPDQPHYRRIVGLA